MSDVALIAGKLEMSFTSVTTLFDDTVGTNRQRRLICEYTKGGRNNRIKLRSHSNPAIATAGQCGDFI
jgi:AraC-like DNA-binding protein